MTSSSSKPFRKLIFFLDLKDYPQEKKLIKDLELLGAKQELFFNKNISFVVSNKVPLKQEFKSPSAPFSNAGPLTYKDSPLNFLNSPISNSSNYEPRACVEPPMPMSRAMTVLQNAKQKIQQRGGSRDIAEICKQWNIKIYPIKRVLALIEKYKSKYYKEHFKKQKPVLTSPSIQKIYAPFIKFEDANRTYRPKFKSFKLWSSLTNTTLLKTASTIIKNYKQFGKLLSISRPVLKEVSARPSTVVSQSSRNESFRTETASFSKVPGCNSISTSVNMPVSVCSSKAFAVEKENHSKCQKVKKNKSPKKGKRHYCDICSVHFTDPEAHYEKKSHLEFLNNSANYKAVEDIILSLPQPADFLAAVQKKEEQETESLENDNQPFDGPLQEDSSGTKIMDSLPNLQNAKEEDCVTEPYTFNQNDYISASCSSQSESMLYLENSKISKTEDGKDFEPPHLMCYNVLETVRCNYPDVYLAQPELSCHDSENMQASLLNPFVNQFFHPNDSDTLWIHDTINCDSGVNVSGDAYINDRMQIKCIDTNQPFYNKLEKACYYNNTIMVSKPFSNTGYIQTEVPLDLSVNLAKDIHVLENQLGCESINIIGTSVSNDIGYDSATALDLTKVSTDSCLTSVSHVATLLNESDSTRNIDATNTSNDGSIINVDAVSISNDNDSVKTIYVTDTSNDGSVNGVYDIKLSKDNLVSTIDTSRFVNDDSSRNFIDAVQVLSNDSGYDRNCHESVSPFVNSVICPMNGSIYKQYNLDKETENYSCSESGSDPDIHMMVSNCINDIDKSLENSNGNIVIEGSLPTIKMTEQSNGTTMILTPVNETGKCIENDNFSNHLKDILPCTKTMEQSDITAVVSICISEIIKSIENNSNTVLENDLPCMKAVEQSNKVIMIEPSYTTAKLGTKRKYFEINDFDILDYSSKKSVNFSNVSRLNESFERPIVSSPSNKMYFQAEDIIDIDYEAENVISVKNSNSHTPLEADLPCMTFQTGDISNKIKMTESLATDAMILNCTNEVNGSFENKNSVSPFKEDSLYAKALDLSKETIRAKSSVPALMISNNIQKINRISENNDSVTSLEGGLSFVRTVDLSRETVMTKSSISTVMISNNFNEIRRSLENDISHSFVESGMFCFTRTEMTSGTFITKLSEVPGKSGTKRKYFEMCDSDIVWSNEKQVEMFDKNKSNEAFEVLVVSSPVKKLCFQKEYHPQTCELFCSVGDVEITSHSPFENKLFAAMSQSNINSLMPIYSKNYGNNKKKFDVQLPPSSFCGQNNSLNAILPKNMNRFENFKLSEMVHSTFEDPSSDDMYIVLDEIETDDDSCHSDYSLDGVTEVAEKTTEYINVCNDIALKDANTVGNMYGENSLPLEINLNDTENKCAVIGQSCESEEINLINDSCIIDAVVSQGEKYCNADVLSKIQRNKLKVVICKMDKNDLKKYGVRLPCDSCEAASPWVDCDLNDLTQGKELVIAIKKINDNDLKKYGVVPALNQY